MGFKVNNRYRLIDRNGFLKHKPGNEIILKNIDNNFGILEPTIVIFGMVVQARFRTLQFCYLEPAEIKFFRNYYCPRPQQTLGFFNGCRNFI